MYKLILIIIVFYFFGCKPEQKENISNNKLPDSYFNIEVNYSKDDTIFQMSLKIYDPSLNDTVFQETVYDDDYKCFMIQLRTHNTPATYLVGVRRYMDIKKYKCFYIRYKENVSYKDIKPNSTLYTSLDEKSLRKIFPTHRGRIITETQYDTLSLGINYFHDLVDNNLIRIYNEKYEYINID